MNRPEADEPSDTHAHPQHLAHHFHTPAQQAESGRLGMWIFLATEVLLFGGLFCAYAVYRSNHPEIFLYAHRYLNKTLGGLNTVILICSSLTMAWAVHAAQRSQRGRSVLLLGLTVLLACGFLGIKYVEYEEKWKHGLLWGKRFEPSGLDEDPPRQASPASTQAAPSAPSAGAATAPATQAATAPADRSTIPPPGQAPAGLAVAEPQPEPKLARPANVQIFFGVYFLMTGLHGLHVVGGMVAILWILVLSVRGRFSAAYFTPVDLVGLYWHLVDMIWIYLFPLLYLIH
jgi:cytochrome c oxidase subunit 3